MLFYFLYAKEGNINSQLKNNDSSILSKTVNNQDKVRSTNALSDSNELSPIPSPELLPVCTLNGQFIQHKAYELYYVNQAEEAAWVAYNLTESHLNGPFHRTNHFEVDPLVSDVSADNEDYLKSGYDRGHLAPAADMTWSAESMEESFYYSNMTPQDPSFNRGKWKELEEQVREWAAKYHQVTVFTGPILTNSSKTIGHDHVIVPRQFYKIIYSNVNGNKQVIAFLMPNETLHNPLTSYVTNIDQIEQLSGINFFEALPDSTENKLESSVNLQQWDFVNNPKTPSWETSSNKTGAVSTICKGLTKAGKPCMNRTKNPNGYCQHHQAQAN